MNLTIRVEHFGTLKVDPPVVSKKEKIRIELDLEVLGTGAI